MRIGSMTPLLGLVALLTAAAAAPAAPPAAGGAPAGAPAGASGGVNKVAIANPAKIFNEIQETKDLKAKMEGDRKNLETQEQTKRQELKDLQAQRDTLKPDSPQYAQLNQKLLEASISF